MLNYDISLKLNISLRQWRHFVALAEKISFMIIVSFETGSFKDSLEVFYYSKYEGGFIVVIRKRK